jgi:RecA-family ATPase
MPMAILPGFVPALDALTPVVEAAAAEFGIEPAYTGRLRARGDDFEKRDDVAAYLLENGHVLGEGREGQLFVECPWKEGHSSDSGITEAAWFPAGTGGFEQGHFRCLHASCAARTDDDYREAVGCGASADFEEIVEPELLPVDLLPLIDLTAWIDEDPPARVWTLHEMILAGQVTYLTGAGATGKSLLGQQLATCIATNTQFLGLDVQQGTAIYVTCEDDADELHRRQKAICAGLGVIFSELPGHLELVSLAGAIGNELATFDQLGRMRTTPAWQRLRSTVLSIGASFVVLDNVAHLFAGNENIRQQVASFLSLLNGLALESGAAILLIGHPNKAGDSFSGSTAWENQVRSRLFLDRVKQTDGTVLDPDARTLSRGKANYSRNGEALAFRWHEWAFILEEDLPDDERAELEHSLRAGAEDDAFLRCLDKAAAEKRATSPNRSASNYAPRVFADMPSGRGISVAGFEAALQRLLHERAIENGQRIYQRDNRSWATGLGRAQTLAQTPAQTLAHQRTNPPSKGGEICTDLRAPTLSPLKGRDGGASEGPPPSPQPTGEKQ